MIPGMETRRARRRLTERAFWGLALGAAAVQVIVVGLLISNSFFIAEDLWLPGLFAELPWSWDTLTRSMFGHLMPGFVAVWKAVASIGVLSWPLVGVIMLAIHVLLFVGTLRLLVALHGRRWWTPVLALAASLSLAVLSCAIWWGAALAPGVGAAAAAWVWDSTVRYLRARSWQRLVAIVLTMTLGMAFGERQLLTPVYLLGFVLLVGFAPGSTFRERRRLALRAWPAWVAMAVVVAAFLTVYLLGSYRDEAGASAPLSELLAYIGRSITEGFLPSVLGVLPGVGAPAFGWIAVATVAAGVVLTSWNSARTRRGWLWLLAVYVLCQLPIAIGRVGIIGVDVAVDTVRYYPEVTLLFWIAASVAVAGGVPRMEAAAARRIGLAAVGLVAVGATGMWLWSTVTMSTTWIGAKSKQYFSELASPDSTLNSALQSGELRMLDVPLPKKLVPPQMFPWNLADRIYPWVRPGTEMTNIVEGSAMLSTDGSPIAPVFTSVPGVVDFTGAGCVSVGDEPLLVLSGALTPDDLGMMVRLTIFADAPSVVRVLSDRPDGSSWAVSNLSEPSYPIPIGKSTLVVPVAPVDAHAITLRVERGADVCVSAADLVRPAVTFGR